MNIARITSGPLFTNTYIVTGKKSCIVIDPTIESVREVMRICHDEKLKVRYIVNTHSHFDHITGDSEIMEKSKVVLAIHELDFDELVSQQPGLSSFKLNKLRGGSRIKLGENLFTVMHTPGHTPGSICLYSEKGNLLFSGDTLFAGSYGRTDMEGGDSGKMLESLKRIASLPGDVRVLPGHGSETRISNEKWLLGLKKSLPF